MKTFDFIQVTISHHLKDPHPKTLEPDCLFPLLAITTQPLKGEGDYRWLLMDKVCIDLGAVFQEILYPNIPVLGRETLTEDLGFEFQSFIKGHFCPF